MSGLVRKICVSRITIDRLFIAVSPSCSDISIDSGTYTSSYYRVPKSQETDAWQRQQQQTHTKAAQRC